MSITDRLQEFIQAQGLNINKVTVRCDLKPGTLNKALKVGKGLHSDTIIALLTYFPEMSADWFILGRGHMLRRYSSMEQSRETNLAADPTGAQSKLDKATAPQSRLKLATSAQDKLLAKLLTPERMAVLIRLAEAEEEREKSNPKP